eukprot:3798561-Pleurochrysis_carterae.AAC.2
MMSISGAVSELRRVQESKYGRPRIGNCTEIHFGGIKGGWPEKDGYCGRPNCRRPESGQSP